MRSTPIDQSSTSRADVATAFPAVSPTAHQIESRGMLRGSSRKLRLSLIALTLVAGSFALPQTSDANLQKRDLRKLGYEGRYVGVVSGRVSSRPGFSGAFSDTLVRRTQREFVPPKRVLKVKSPDGAGVPAYRIVNRVRVNQRRAIIDGRYFGTVFNPTLEANLVRTGSKRLEIKRSGLQRFRFSARLVDNMIERNQDGGAIIKQWTLRGSLR